MRIPPVQQRVTAIATKELSAYLGVPVQIKRTDIQWLHEILLEDVVLPDRQGQVLLKAHQLKVGFEFLPMLQNRFVFNTVRLFGMDVHLRKASADKPLNMQFLIDAFASRDTVKREHNFDLKLNTVLVRHCNFSYHIEDRQETPGQFNAAHIHVHDLNAKISLRALTKDSINAEIRRVSFEEASGFTLKKLSLALVGNADSVTIDQFNIQLPATDIRLDRSRIALNGKSNLSAILNEAPLHLAIVSSEICLKDFSSFVPAFRNFNESMELFAEATGTVNNLNLQNVSLKYSNKMLFVGNMQFRGLTDDRPIHLNGEVSKMYIATEGIAGIADNFSDRHVELPELLVHLGTINFTGSISGYIDDLKANGRLSSNVGAIETQMRFGKDPAHRDISFLKADITTSRFRLGELLSDTKKFGEVSFHIKVDANKPKKGVFAGDLSAQLTGVDFKGHRYDKASIDGRFTPHTFYGSLLIDDPDAYLNASGYIRQEGHASAYNFTADIRHLHPDLLHLTGKYEEPEISCRITTDFTGNRLDNLEGRAVIEDLDFYTLPSSFRMNRLEVQSSGASDHRTMEITSDFLNGKISGAFSFATIVPNLVHSFGDYLPALVHERYRNVIQRAGDSCHFEMALTMDSCADVCRTLKLPFSIDAPSRLNAFYNKQYQRFRLEAWLPKFQFGTTRFENAMLQCENPDDQISVELQATNYNEKGLRNYIRLRSNAKDNVLQSVLNWNNNKENRYQAAITASTKFTQEIDEEGRSDLLTDVTLQPSTLTIKDTTWTIPSSEMVIRNGRVNVRHFSVENGSQHLMLNGYMSHDPADTLQMELQQLELSYVFDILNIEVLQFGGKATGQFYLNDVFNSCRLNADFEVNDFSFNQVVLGRLNMFSEWDNEQKGISMLGTIYKNDSTWTDVNGIIYPVGSNSGLSLYFDANDINLAFLHPFVDGVVDNMQGSGFGNIHLYGPFSKLNVVGDALIKGGGFGVGFLNTYYNVDDSVHLTPTTIEFRNVTAKDKFGNRAQVSFLVNHEHFHNFNFNADISAEKFLVYDATAKQNPLMYGTVFATGTTTMKGNGDLIKFDVNMQSEPNTVIGLNFMESTTADDYNFIKFVDRSALAAGDSAKADREEKGEEDDEGTELRMNFHLDVTPDAEIQMVMDPTAGDMIKGKAAGNLQIQYGTKSDLRIYGGLNITEGKYHFSMQQIIHRDFTIRDGSTVSFNGDPYSANLDVNAIYSVTANLGDLDEGLLAESSRSSVPVNCVLNINGELRNPGISFELELPGSNEELERQVNALINTEDMKTRQILYLLVLNKFYTPDYANGYRSNEFSAMASSAISQQLSGLLNSFTDKVQIGANIRASQDGFTNDTEMEMLLSSQLLNNRLLFNGNFGYKNNTNLNQNVFVGEFDLEYKLTKTGDIRLKAYNHANDMYQYLKQSLTTQGVGVMFKRDFNRFYEIFRRTRVLAPPPVRTDSVRAADKKDASKQKNN